MLALAMLVGAGAGVLVSRGDEKGATARAYAERRLPVIAHQLLQATPGYVLVAGDSHAELMLFSDFQCSGRADPMVITAAVSGVNAELYRRTFARLHPPVKAGLTVFSIGTNDLFIKKNPLSPKQINKFRNNAARILEEMRKNSDRVIVMAIPPMADNTTKILDADAVERYSDVLRELCASPRCNFVDPYEANRTPGRFGIAREGTMSLDGIHMLSYDRSVEMLHDYMCATTGQAIR